MVLAPAGFLAVLLLALPPTVTMSATDGKDVIGAWQAAAAPKGADPRLPAMILVTDEGRPTKEWEPVQERLAKAGVSSLAFTPRSTPGGKPLSESSLDIAGAIAWLKARKDVDGARILIGGAGPSALAALHAAGKDRSIAGVAAFSPAIDGKRLDDEDLMTSFGSRPFFSLLARGDKLAAKSALVLDANAKGRKKMFIADGSRGGAELLAGDEAAFTAFLAWQKSIGSSESGTPAQGSSSDPVIP